jgi:hypothetical protein
VVHGWLREYGPIAFFGHSGIVVLECDGAFMAGPRVCSVPHSVTADCKVQFDKFTLSLCDSAARYSTSDPTDENCCYEAHFTCTKIASINGRFVLLCVNCSNPCAHHPSDEQFIVSDRPGLRPGAPPDVETPLRWPSVIGDMDQSPDHITMYYPSRSGLEKFVDILATFAFPNGIERSFLGWPTGSAEGIIRFNRKPRLHWTEAGCIRRTAAVSAPVIRYLQPMLAFIRPRKLGIRIVKRPEGDWKYTLVDERTEYTAPTVSGRRRRVKTERFSPL